MEESTLIEQAKKGDKKSLTTILHNNRDLITSITFKYLKNRERSEDAVQNILMKIVKYIDSFKGNCTLSTWIYRIAVNECLEMIKKDKTYSAHITSVEKPNTLSVPDPDSANGFVATLNNELHRDIQLALGELPRDQEHIFSLFYMKSYSGKEVAQSLNITEANLFMKLKSARDKVKDYLQKKGWHL